MGVEMDPEFSAKQITQLASTTIGDGAVVGENINGVLTLLIRTGNCLERDTALHKGSHVRVQSVEVGGDYRWGIAKTPRRCFAV